ncbi:hypothetical protein PFISCL1PPCAC_28197, partial [Pristionchus fissidentatus]
LKSDVVGRGDVTQVVLQRHPTQPADLKRVVERSVTNDNVVLVALRVNVCPVKLQSLAGISGDVIEAVGIHRVSERIAGRVDQDWRVEVLRGAVG